MGMTMTQKILAAHAGLESVKAGQLIEAKLDIVHGNDVTTPVAVKEFNKIGVKEVFDKNKVTIVPDHFTPNNIVKLSENLPVKRALKIILRLDRWVLNIAFCRRQDLLYPEMLL